MTWLFLYTHKLAKNCIILVNISQQSHVKCLYYGITFKIIWYVLPQRLFFVESMWKTEGWMVEHRTKALQYQKSAKFFLITLLLEHYGLAETSTSPFSAFSFQHRKFLKRWLQVNNSPRRPSSPRRKSSYRFSNTSHCKPCLCVVAILKTLSWP